MGLINSKKGSVEVIFMCFISLFFMFIFFSIYLLYSKIDINLYKVKQDLFNIVQNVVLALDEEELAYNNFKINEEIMVEKIDKLISLTYNNVKLENLFYDVTENKVNITLEVDLKLEKWKLKDKVKISESIKLDMMRLKYEK